MAKYLRCNLVDMGEEITFGEFVEKYKSGQDSGIPFETKGYAIRDPLHDGYVDFYDTEQISKKWLRLDDNKNLPSGVSIGQEMVDNFIKDYEVIERDGKTTIVHATLINGYKLVESSSCVDPANYDREMGVQICLYKIKNQLWQLLGFLLQTAVGLNK